MGSFTKFAKLQTAASHCTPLWLHRTRKVQYICSYITHISSAEHAAIVAQNVQYAGLRELRCSRHILKEAPSRYRKV
ncbi:hypothetical protein XENTR_v10000289 [Xenopus tropicalis]|nr:hypothetical protein XENTR_v10000289 [Xenopus tropicalis]